MYRKAESDCASRYAVISWLLGVMVRTKKLLWRLNGGAIVLPGVTIGDNCVIGAGSVVTKSIPANSVAAGNPCEVIRRL